MSNMSSVWAKVLVRMFWLATAWPIHHDAWVWFWSIVPAALLPLFNRSKQKWDNEIDHKRKRDNNNQFSFRAFHSQFITWKGDEVAQSAEDFLLYHKFGHVSNYIAQYIILSFSCSRIESRFIPIQLTIECIVLFYDRIIDVFALYLINSGVKLINR